MPSTEELKQRRRELDLKTKREAEAERLATEEEEAEKRERNAEYQRKHHRKKAEEAKLRNAELTLALATHNNANMNNKENLNEEPPHLVETPFGFSIIEGDEPLDFGRLQMLEASIVCDNASKNNSIDKIAETTKDAKSKIVALSENSGANEAKFRQMVVQGTP